MAVADVPGLAWACVNVLLRGRKLTAFGPVARSAASWEVWRQLTAAVDEL